jgi:thioredoxin reductase (NADPH)
MKAGVRLTGKPRSIRCNSRTIAVGLKGGDHQDLDVLYAAMGCCVRSQLATTLGAACTESGNLKVDEHQQTTVDGLYAIGDVVSDLHQLSVAIGHGAIAATHIHNRLPPVIARPPGRVPFVHPSIADMKQGWLGNKQLAAPIY